MTASSVCRLIVAIDGCFYKVASNDSGDPTLGSVILHHIPLSDGGPQPTRHVSAILLRELIAAGEAVPVIGDLTDSHDSHDSQGAEHRALKDPASLPCRLVEPTALKTEPLPARIRPSLLSFGQQRQSSAA